MEGTLAQICIQNNNRRTSKVYLMVGSVDPEQLVLSYFSYPQRLMRSASNTKSHKIQKEIRNEFYKRRKRYEQSMRIFSWRYFQHDWSGNARGGGGSTGSTDPERGGGRRRAAKRNRNRPYRRFSEIRRHGRRAQTPMNTIIYSARNLERTRGYRISFLARRRIFGATAIYPARRSIWDGRFSPSHTSWKWNRIITITTNTSFF
jgi:hypothetical protein